MVRCKAFLPCSALRTFVFEVPTVVGSIPQEKIKSLILLRFELPTVIILYTLRDRRHSSLRRQRD